MQQFHDAVIWLNGWLWGMPMLVLLVGTHLFLTFRLRFIQRYLWQAIKLSFHSDKASPGDVSQFGALMTSLAATIGTGNIVGVSTAIALGGPGAVLWCWLTGVFGIATKYAEAVLAVRYRVQTEDGTMLGGPMYALERGLGQKWLAVVFCICTAIAAFGIGNTVQANSLASMMNETFAVPPLATGACMAVLVGLVLLGGVRWIARICEVLVPFMALFYIIGCIVLLVLNAGHVWPAVKLIITSAFTPQAAGGGFAGSAVLLAARYGIARGLFSNESGLGSAPIVAAAAQTRNPVRQALVSSSGTFWDTVVVCAMTGIVIVSSILNDPPAFEAVRSSGALFTRAAFAQIPVVGPTVLAVGLMTFVFSTILGWSYYGERAMEYLCGKKAITAYRIAWVAAVFAGSVMTLPLVWDLADAMNAMMAIPNLIALLLLSKVIVAETQKYLWQNRLDDTGD